MQRLWTKKERLALFEDYVEKNNVKMNRVSMWFYKRGFLASVYSVDTFLSWIHRKDEI